MQKVVHDGAHHTPTETVTAVSHTKRIQECRIMWGFMSLAPIGKWRRTQHHESIQHAIQRCNRYACACVFSHTFTVASSATGISGQTGRCQLRALMIMHHTLAFVTWISRTWLQTEIENRNWCKIVSQSCSYVDETLHPLRGYSHLNQSKNRQTGCIGIR